MGARALPRLFCITSIADDVSLLSAFAAAGVTGFQVRDKRASSRELLRLTAQVRSAVGDACVIVNDRLDVALAAGADGVHLGGDDLPVEIARALAPDLLIGATCRDRTAVEAALAAGADYAGFGPVFRSSSKEGLPEPLGLEAITAAAGLLPLVAIGGVDGATAVAARDAGAHGVAVIAGLWRDPDPVAAAWRLSAAVAR